MQRAKKAFEAISDMVRYPFHDFQASTKGFLNLNIEKIAREMKLEEVGAERGASNHPPPDAVSLDDTELAIVHRVERAATDDYALYHDRQQTYHERFHRLNVLNQAGNIRASAREALSYFSTEVSQGRDELYQFRGRVAERRADLDDFKQRHKLTRSAMYPESTLFRWGVLLLLLLIEGALNGNLLSAGNEFGLLGGVMNALVIALLNVGAGFVVGNVFFRLLFHRSLAKRAVGTIVSLAYLVAIVGFNLVVAHYRDALVGPDPEQAGELALQAVLSQPLAIGSVESLFLLLMGISFSLIAAFDALRMDDPYPGFGELDRRLQAARMDYSERKEELLDALGDLREKGVSTMRAAQQDLSKRLSEHKVIVEGSRRLALSMRDHLEQLERGCQHLLAIYRRANSVARSAASPAHFSYEYQLEPRDTASACIVVGDKDAIALDESVEVTSGVLEESIQKVQDAFDGAVEQYKELERVESPGVSNG